MTNQDVIKWRAKRRKHFKPLRTSGKQWLVKGHSASCSKSLKCMRGQKEKRPKTYSLHLCYKYTFHYVYVLLTYCWADSTVAFAVVTFQPAWSACWTTGTPPIPHPSHLTSYACIDGFPVELGKRFSRSMSLGQGCLPGCQTLKLSGSSTICSAPPNNRNALHHRTVHWKP